MVLFSFSESNLSLVSQSLQQCYCTVVHTFPESLILMEREMLFLSNFVQLCSLCYFLMMVKFVESLIISRPFFVARPFLHF